MDFAELAAERDRRPSDYPPFATLQNVALVLCSNANRGGKVWVTVLGICRQLRLPGARRSVQRALRALEDFGVIEFTGETAGSGARKYALAIGWDVAEEEAAKLEAAELELEPKTNEAIVIEAYRAARMKRHEVASMSTTRSWVVTAVTTMLSEISALTGDTFGAVADRAMRIYMNLTGLDDGKLVKAHHPLDWITPYISTIEKQLRAAHKKSREKSQAEPPPVAQDVSAEGFRALSRAVSRPARPSPNDRARATEQERVAKQVAARAALDEHETQIADAARTRPLKKVGG